MKTPCKNPNGLQNMATIVDSKTRKAVKFNSLDKAKEHLKSKGYRFRQAFSFKYRITFTIKIIGKFFHFRYPTS